MSNEKSSFKIFIKLEEAFYRYYTIELRPRGLYLVSNTSSGDHFSYHTDGVCFHHFLGERKQKKIRNPLNEPKQIESLSTVNILKLDKVALEKQAPALKENDIVIERAAPFCFEIILSDKPIQLPRIAGRVPRECHQRKIGHLHLTVEVFKNTSQFVADLRYSPYTWVVGENFFMWIDGKWQ